MDFALFMFSSWGYGEQKDFQLSKLIWPFKLRARRLISLGASVNNVELQHAGFVL